MTHKCHQATPFHTTQAFLQKREDACTMSRHLPGRLPNMRGRRTACAPHTRTAQLQEQGSSDQALQSKRWLVAQAALGNSRQREDRSPRLPRCWHGSVHEAGRRRAPRSLRRKPSATM